MSDPRGRRELLRAFGTWSIGAWSIGVLPWFPRTARAHPVRIGRYTEIPYGIRPDHPMPTEGAGPRRTHRLAGPVPVAEPDRAWEVVLGSRRARGPTVSADGALYVGSMGGLHALSPDGTQRWLAEVGAVHSAPSLSPSSDVIAVTRGGEVLRVSPGGQVVRRSDLGAPARGSPLVLDDGSVLIATIDRRVHRLDANLRPVFQAELSDGTAGTLSRTRRGLLAVTSGRTVTLLTAEGARVREVGLPGRVTTALAVADDGTSWVSTTEGLLTQLDPRGRVRAQLDVGSRHFDGASLAIAPDGSVRVPTMTEGIVCVGPGGTERWRFPNPPGFSGPASVGTDGTTLAVDRTGRMIAVDPQGAERWRVVLGTYSFSPPVLGADGTIYIALERGQLQAWH
ncbi:MAG: PQQ-binding-like beta-propeller repeat protein [Sandaracinaceae bacterium]